MKTLPLVFALAMSLAGCLPVSQNPLSTPDEAAADSHLAGLWYGKSGEDKIFLHFVPGEGAKVQAVEVDHVKKGEAHATIYTLFPSTIDGQHYLNIREGKKDDTPYYFGRYRFAESGALTIWLMSEKATAKAVDAGRLAGKLTTKSNGEHDVKLTDTTAHLAAFVRKSDPDVLFDQKFGTFKKVTLPDVESASPAVKKAPEKSKPATKRKRS